MAQSYSGWPYARTGGPVKTEEDPLDPTPAREMRESLARSATSRRRSSVRDWTEGIVLRYGAFYGPGTSLSPGGEQVEMVRKRKFPVVGNGGGVWSFIHIADAAEATVAAVEHGSAGSTTSSTTTRPRSPSGCRRWRRALGAPKPMARAAVRRAAVRGRGRRGDDDRDSRRVERQGQARARVGAATSELAGGVRAA